MCGGGEPEEVKPTADQIEQARINAEMWNYYQTNYKPLIDKYTARTTDATQARERKNLMSGQINADLMRGVPSAKPSSNAVSLAKAAARIADVGTGAQVSGQAAARSREIADTQNIINIGRGEETTAVAGLEDLATRSVQREISKEMTDQAVDAAMIDALGSGIGTAAAVAMGVPASPKRKTETPEIIET